MEARGLAWILIGMMGSGKSSVGRALAETTARPFRDTDLMLQSRLGHSITHIFERYGQDCFRDHETSLLRSLDSEPCILSTGGGIILRPENWIELRRLGMIVYLRASKETLRERLESSKKRRPLLGVANWEEELYQILESRLSLYEQADLVVDVDGRVMDDIAADIASHLS